MTASALTRPGERDRLIVKIGQIDWVFCFLVCLIAGIGGMPTAGGGAGAGGGTVVGVSVVAGGGLPVVGGGGACCVGAGETDDIVPASGEACRGR